MTRIFALLPCLLLVACAKPVTDTQRTQMADGNKLQISRGMTAGNHFVLVENLDKQWGGKYAGGKEKWGARKDLLQDLAAQEISRLCGGWEFSMKVPYQYNMLDHDETAGGVAPVLGTTASMVAYLAAYSSTKDENIPVSVYTEFSCRIDEDN